MPGLQLKDQSKGVREVQHRALLLLTTGLWSLSVIQVSPLEECSFGWDMIWEWWQNPNHTIRTVRRKWRVSDLNRVQVSYALTSQCSVWGVLIDTTKRVFTVITRWQREKKRHRITNIHTSNIIWNTVV